MSRYSSFITVILATGLAAFSSGFSLAAESPSRHPVSLTLASALELAWARHPQAASVSAREDEARATLERAGALSPEPASIGFGNLNDRLNSNQGKNEFELELGVPLWLPGQRAARLSEAEALVALVAAQQAALKHQLASEVRSAWWAAAAARAMRQLAEQRLSTAKALEATVTRRFRAGDLSRIDSNLAQSERLDAEAALIETSNALLAAEQSFQALTGINPPQDLASEKLTGEMPSHPELAAAVANSQTAQARVRSARHDTRATPELSLRLERNRDNSHEPYDNSVGIRLKFPLPSDARFRQGNAQAQVEASEAEAGMAQIRVRLDLAATRARLELHSAETQLALAQTRLELSEDNLRLSEKGFALGETDLTALLRVRAAAYDARNQHERQRLARAAAVSNMNQALGVLP